MCMVVDESESLQAGSDLSLPGLCGPNLVTLLFVGRQSPPRELAVRTVHFAGMKSLAAFGAAIDAIAVGYPIFLITPVTHLRHRIIISNLIELLLHMRTHQ